jgi:tetratricopeptide (TPR) repeat protein
LNKNGLISLFSLAFILFTGCGSVKDAADLPYREQKAFEHYYFEASKQKILGNNDRAISLFHLALIEFPKSHASMYQLGGLYYLQKDIIKAEEWALKAVETSPTYNYWYFGQLAEIYSKLGKFESSAEVFEQMVREEPDRQDVYIEAVNQYLNASMPLKALDVLDRLEKRVGITEESATRKEYIYIGLGKHAEAIAVMEGLIEAYPDQRHYRGYLAETLIHADQKDKAIVVLEELLALDSSFGRGSQMLHDLYREKGDVYKAYGHLRNAFRSDDVPLADKLQLFSGYYVQMSSNTLSKSMAIELSDILLEMYPQSDVPYIVKGDVYFRLDSLNLSRNFFVKATELETDHRTWDKLISVDSRIGNLKWQIEDAERAIERFPNVPGFYLAKAYALHDSGLYQQSLSACQDGLDIAMDTRDLVELYACSGQNYGELKQYDNADRNYENALEIDADNALIMNNYAYALAEQGRRLPEALDWVNKALLREPGNPYYMDTKAWILYKQGKGAEAIPLLERALLLDKDGMVYLEHLAEICHSLGQLDKAKEYLDRAKAKGSTLELE